MGVARFLRDLGFSLIITDIKTKKELSSSIRDLRSLKNITLRLGKHEEKDFKNASFIVKNPAIPDSSSYLKLARSHNIPITNDTDIFLTLTPREKLIGLTGTKGKTTTTMLIGHLLGPEACIVGTPGVSIFEYFYQKKEPSYVVAEFSSFDLEYAHTSPHVAVLTSLFPDHLNRYDSFASYASAKMNLVRFQQKGDVLFTWDDENIRKHIVKTKGKIVWVKKTTRHDIPLDKAAWQLSQTSILLAISVATYFGIPKQKIQSRLSSFKPPHGRLEMVGKTKQYLFINDTTATNPGSAMYSLQALSRKFTNQRITIITGGVDKGFPTSDYQAYAEALKKYRIHVVALEGSFMDLLEKFLPLAPNRHSSFKTALREATQESGIVVLLPAAASFNLFKNEFDREKKFIAEVKKYL